MQVVKFINDLPHSIKIVKVDMLGADCHFMQSFSNMLHKMLHCTCASVGHLKNSYYDK